VTDPRRIDESAAAISRRLRSCGIAHALGGALAYNYFGVPRTTGDIDFNVFVSVEDASAVFDCLTAIGVEVSAKAAAELERDWQVRLWWEGRYIDLFFAYHAFHDSCRARAVERDVTGEMVPVLTAEDVVVFKTIFNRPRDWGDIERVLDVQREHFDIAYALHWLDDILGPDDTARNRLAAMHREVMEN